ncbi:hypothetical protein [Paraflavitalea speifideaquila]|uniref:hypothetical protein n=1 Tax=Paraflavitalea speifideaquila TaxID=3076558 RepID=UPI0028EFD9BD|nr:hypothetical protein [Paraflavitalea speifideiaquila]
MPKQISPIVKLKGAIDDLSFYKSQDGFMARQKTSISAERMKTDPKFDLTRRAGQEFGAGGKSGKLFRDVWITELNKARDNRVTSRVTQAMVAILQSDPVSDLGFRRVENGDLTLLKDLSSTSVSPLRPPSKPCFLLSSTAFQVRYPLTCFPIFQSWK